jgi:hypothetical protein
MAATTASGPWSWGVGRRSGQRVAPSGPTTAPFIVVPPTSRATTHPVTRVRASCHFTEPAVRPPMR